MPYKDGSSTHVRAPKEKMVLVCRRQCLGNWENQSLWDRPWLGSCFRVMKTALPSRLQNKRNLCPDKGKR